MNINHQKGSKIVFIFVHLYKIARQIIQYVVVIRGYLNYVPCYNHLCLRIGNYDLKLTRRECEYLKNNNVLKYIGFCILQA